MRGGALPPALLCAALGFALAFASPRLRREGSGLLILTALSATVLFNSFKPLEKPWVDTAFWGCWGSIVIAAAAVHLPARAWEGRRARLLVMALSFNSGVWVGAVIAAAGAPLDLFKALPIVVLAFPCAWLVATNRQIAIKVVASWLIAVAVLAASLPVTTPTPGYVPDHMD